MSSKTRKANSKNAIASARKYARLLITSAILLLIMGFWLVDSLSNHTLSMGGQTFKIEYADTPSDQEKGLGGRNLLSADSGMLFRFRTPSEYCFWMKDMRFNLDIIWISAAKKINHIETNISPTSYPSSFCPDDEAKYVLEVTAGTAARLDLQIGDSISF